MLPNSPPAHIGSKQPFGHEPAELKLPTIYSWAITAERLGDQALKPFIHPERAPTACRRAILVAVVVLTSVLGLTGCSKVINAIKTAHNVLHEGAAISALSNKIKSADKSPYEVTYVTTGSNPVTTELAASPPRDFAFGTTVSGQILDVISNSKGEFACSRGLGSSATWSCIEVKGAEVETYKLMYALYSGAYWIDFLKLYSAAAALQGVTNHSTTMSVNGFGLQCVVIVNKKSPGTSKWCVTSQGILGYVSVSSAKADFEIKSYSASPPASLFQVPLGATITTIPTVTTIPTTTS